MEHFEDPTLEPPSLDKVEPGSSLPYTPPPRARAQSAIEKADTIAREGFPELYQKAKDFYARHPTLVKTAAVVVLASVAKRVFRPR